MVVNTLNEGLVADKIREDTQKIQIIMQYLESRGLMKTLAQMEDETGVIFSPMSLAEGGVLDSLIDSQTNTNESSSEPTSSPLPPPGACATQIACKREHIHGGMNPTSVVWSKSEPGILFTGGVDGKIFQWKWDESCHEVSESGPALSVPSPVLFLDTSCDGHIAATCMGGEVVLFTDRYSETACSVSRPHGTNRVICAKFSPDGNLVATFGRDIAVVFMKRDTTGVWKELPSATIRFEREVSSICWISADTIVVAETGNCMLGVYQIVDDCRKSVGEMCMNKSARDPRSSYSLLMMTFHEDLRLLAGCTSRNSAILFHLPATFDERLAVYPIKTYYGMSLGLYDFPSIMFSVDGSFLYVTSDKELIVFETKTCHKVFSINGSESKPIRCVSRHFASDVLATVSFDKSMYVIS